MASSLPAFWNVPALQPLTGLVLAAWDDAFLTPAELLSIREALEQADGVDELAKQVLAAWLNPEAPPPASALRALERALAGAPHDLPFALSVGPQARSWQPRASEAQRGLVASLEGPHARELGSKRERAGVPGEADVFRWRAALDGDLSAMRDTTRELLQTAPFNVPREAEIGADREQVLGWVRELSALPLFERADEDSMGQNVGPFLAAFETIALFDLSLVVKFGVQFGLFAGAIQNLGTARHHALLPDIARCKIVGCFAMTERAHGSNVRALQTVARYDAEAKSFVITSPSLAAGKEWIGNAALHARMAVVFAQLETGNEQFGVHAFLVPIRDEQGTLLPGVRAEDCGHKMGLNGVDNGRLWFEDVRVPRDALLDRFGQVAEDGTYSSPIPSSGKRFFTMLGTLVGGRINVAGGALAASKVGLAIAIRYANHRRQFPNAAGEETLLFDYLSHRQRLLPALASAYAFSFAQHELIRHIDEAKADPKQGRDIGTLAAGVKALGTWQATETLQHCRECCGGQGYLTSNRIDGLRTDADVFTTFEGDNTVLLQLVAKDLLRAQLRSFQENPVRAIARSWATNVSSAITEHNPVATRRTDSDSLLSAEFHAAALRHRERSLLASLSARIRKRTDAGVDGQVAFEACQDHALALARAHIESHVLESFQKHTAGDRVLEQLCALYALSRIARDFSWFLEDNYLAGNKSRAIRKQINGLLEELAPTALPLVEAFGIPANCLGPLADPAFLKDSGLAPQG